MSTSRFSAASDEEVVPNSDVRRFIKACTRSSAGSITLIGVVCVVTM